MLSSVLRADAKQLCQISHNIFSIIETDRLEYALTTLKLIEMQWSKNPEAIESTKRLAKVMLNFQTWLLQGYYVKQTGNKHGNLVSWSCEVCGQFIKEQPSIVG